MKGNNAPKRSYAAWLLELGEAGVGMLSVQLGDEGGANGGPPRG